MLPIYTMTVGLFEYKFCILDRLKGCNNVLDIQFPTYLSLLASILSYAGIELLQVA